jgi:hypothetical protein
MKIRPLGTEQTDGQTDIHDETNIRFRNFANALKKG